jgi:hypothetical protein
MRTELIGDPKINQILMDISGSVLTVSLYEETVKNSPHQLVALVEHTFDPDARDVSPSNYQNRLAVGLLGCRPNFGIVNGRLFFNTHGYFEIPNLNASDFFGTPIHMGPLHPEWAHYYRLSQNILIPPNYYDTVITSNKMLNPNLSQVGFYLGDEVPALLKELSPRIAPGAAQDLATINHLLLNLAEHAQTQA